MSVLHSLGASPRKRLGQNFLHDRNIASWIVEKLEIGPGQHVVEIGPGLGALTEEIIRWGLSITLLEKDRAFAKYLREKFERPNVEVIEGDALEYDTRVEFLRRPAKVIGNLPYYLSSALLFHFTADPCPFEHMVFTVQKEMASRLSATPKCKEYGSLSVIIQRQWQVTRLKTLPPSVFLPQPQVDSVVVSLKRRMPGAFEEADAGEFAALVKAGFSERRKQVRNLLSRFGDPEQIEIALLAAAVAFTARAEDISIEQWIRILNVLQPPVIYGSNPGELLSVVDQNDEPLEPLARATIHRENLLHRAVHILLVNRRGELLLQKRSHRKDRFPRRWDSSAAGHVDAHESYRECAMRELLEELGVTATLAKIGKIPASEATGREFIEIFAGIHDGPFHWNQHEIETGGFFNLKMVDHWIATRPQDFAPGFVECYREVRVPLGDLIVRAREESG
ncbi:MAG: ribosomal RNA small subunit methyltransferase A [Verrucomicrobia bacterium]|nr:ribosomal RNA small subunit methyltransferase A [Verrucomicrobiota bacterium]